MIDFDQLIPAFRTACPHGPREDGHFPQNDGYCRWDPVLQKTRLAASVFNFSKTPGLDGRCRLCRRDAIVSAHRIDIEAWRQLRLVWIKGEIMALDQARRNLARDDRGDMIVTSCSRCGSEDMLFACRWSETEHCQPDHHAIENTSGPEGHCQVCQAVTLSVQSRLSSHRALRLAKEIDARMKDFEIQKALLTA